MNPMSNDHLLWRDGHKIFNVGKPRKQTPNEELQMKHHKPTQCPPILHGDCTNIINDFLRATRRIVDARTGETAGSTDSNIAASLAVFTGLQNVAAYLSAAINNGSGEIAESLNRLARAVENLTPAVEPPTLVRLRDVSRRIGISSESVMKLSRKGQFPAAIYLDDSGVPFFTESQVNEWLASKVA